MRTDTDADFIQVDGVSKGFDVAHGQRGRVHALDNVSISVRRGEMIALLGPSGSGKTTLLRCIAGLERVDAGRIRIGSVVVAAPGVHRPPGRRGLGMIFQNYALWPHLTVFENVAYPLRVRHAPTQQLTSKVREYLKLVECLELAERLPHQISGGQQQRVALARALVYAPDVVLFDEPLSNLDSGLREGLRHQIRQIQQLVGFTGVYVTHDQSEAFYVGDRVAIIGGGRRLQTGTPRDVFEQPVSPTVAQFLGCTNWVRGRLTSDGARWYVSLDLGLRLAAGPARAWFRDGEDVIAATRPDEIAIEPPSASLDGVDACVEESFDLGHHTEYILRLVSGPTWRCRLEADVQRHTRGENVRLTLGKRAARIFPAVEASEAQLEAQKATNPDLSVTS